MGNRPPQSTSGRRWPRDVRDLFRSTQASRHRKDGYTGSDGHQHVLNRSEAQVASSNTNGRRSWRDKLNSCPDLQGAASRGLSAKLQEQQSATFAHQEIQPPTKLNYKIYRSYSELPPSNDALDADNRGRSSRMASCADIPVVEVRVYRRSTETLATSNDRRRAQSLPRGMDLRRSLGSDLAGAATTGSGSSGDSRCGSTSLHGSHYTDLGGGGYSRSTSRKASARSSVASIAARVSSDEFPDGDTVRRKREEFERNFTATFVDAFKCLAPLNQLAAMCVATRPDRANQAVSLLQYLESDAIPADIATSCQASDDADTREYCLTIPLSRFPEVRRLKVEDRTAVDSRLVTCQLLAEDMARSAARELSRMFEYQLSLINESVAFRLLARNAVDCILNASRRRSRILDANGLVRGVIRGRPPCAEGPMFVSVFVGTRELKWNLNEVFKKPGLRRELPHGGALESNRLMMSSSTTSGIAFNSMSRSSLLIGSSTDGRSSSCEVDQWRTETYRSPWRFFTSPRCEPMKYGYRGQIVERDYAIDGYRLNSEDESSFPEEVTIRYDDFHRIYSPLRRLVGVETISDYCACASTDNEQTTSGHTLVETTAAGTSPHLFNGITDYVRRWVPVESYARDDVEVLFRPIGVPLPDTVSASMTSYAASDFHSFVQKAVNRKRPVGSMATGDGKGVDNGVRRAAIEVTRACDELSGKLEGEFSWKADRIAPNERMIDCDFSRMDGNRNPGDVRTTTSV